MGEPARTENMAQTIYESTARANAANDMPILAGIGSPMQLQLKKIASFLAKIS
jgi:hypothetical protein